MIRDCFYLPPFSRLRFLYANELSDSGIVVLYTDKKIYKRLLRKNRHLNRDRDFFFKNRIKIYQNLKKQNRDHTKHIHITFLC